MVLRRLERTARLAHVLSDLAIFGAYAAIPLSILYFARRKRQELEFPRLYWLFAGFILSCGLTHLIEATIFWQPWYRFAALIKLITAILSWGTVFALIRILPAALQLPGTAGLNQRLRREILEREQSEAAVKESSARLELALEHAGLGEWTCDPATPSSQISRRAGEIVGLDQQPVEDLATLARLAVALTGFASPEDRRRAIEAGFDTFLSKPADIQELLAVVQRHGGR